MLLLSRFVTVDKIPANHVFSAIMNAMLPITMDFRPAYWQIEPLERKFVDGYVADIESIADKTGQRLLAVLQAPFPYELDMRARALLARPLVRAAVAERIKELSDAYDISVYKTLKEVVAIAYSNIGNYFTIDPNTGLPDLDWSKCTPEMLSAVKSIEIEDKPRGGRKYKMTLHDKNVGLNALMRYQGLLADDNDHWRKQEQSVQPSSAAQLPKGTTDDGAANLYSRYLSQD